LVEYLAAREQLPEAEARKFFQQMASAIEHCHQNGVVHRDLKLENLLLSASREILISDFGLGRTFVGEEYMQVPFVSLNMSLEV
jgi:serine/threonine protein kinase